MEHNESDTVTDTLSLEDQNTIFLYHQNGSWQMLTSMLAPRSAHAVTTVRLRGSSTAVTSDNILLIAAFLLYSTCSPTL